MEKNGASNGQDSKPQKSPPATGASKSPKKRRKVNHGTSSDSAARRRSLKRGLIVVRVPAACVYCRRSVSLALGLNTWKYSVYAPMRILFGRS
jgi:hypothetical protein